MAAASGRGSLRPYQPPKSQSFLILCLLVAFLVVGYNYWITSAGNNQLSADVLKLRENVTKLKYLQTKCTDQLSQNAVEKKILEESNNRNEQAVVDKIREATDLQTYNRQLQNDLEGGKASCANDRVKMLEKAEITCNKRVDDVTQSLGIQQSEMRNSWRLHTADLERQIEKLQKQLNEKQGQIEEIARLLKEKETDLQHQRQLNDIQTKHLQQQQLVLDQQTPLNGQERPQQSQKHEIAVNVSQKQPQLLDVLSPNVQSRGLSKKMPRQHRFLSKVQFQNGTQFSGKHRVHSMVEEEKQENDQHETQYQGLEHSLSTSTNQSNKELEFKQKEEIIRISRGNQERTLRQNAKHEPSGDVRRRQMETNPSILGSNITIENNSAAFGPDQYDQGSNFTQDSLTELLVVSKNKRQMLYDRAMADNSSYGRPLISENGLVPAVNHKSEQQIELMQNSTELNVSSSESDDGGASYNAPADGKIPPQEAGLKRDASFSSHYSTDVYPETSQIILTTLPSRNDKRIEKYGSSVRGGSSTMKKYRDQGILGRISLASDSQPLGRQPQQSDSAKSNVSNMKHGSALDVQARRAPLAADGQIVRAAAIQQDSYSDQEGVLLT